MTDEEIRWGNWRVRVDWLTGDRFIRDADSGLAVRLSERGFMEMMGALAYSVDREELRHLPFPQSPFHKGHPLTDLRRVESRRGEVSHG